MNIYLAPPTFGYIANKFVLVSLPINNAVYFARFTLFDIKTTDITLENIYLFYNLVL